MIAGDQPGTKGPVAAHAAVRQCPSTGNIHNPWSYVQLTAPDTDVRGRPSPSVNPPNLMRCHRSGSANRWRLSMLRAEDAIAKSRGQAGDVRGTALLVLGLALAGTACGSSLSASGPSDTVSRLQEEQMKLSTVAMAGALALPAVAGGQPAEPTCVVRVDFDAKAQLFHAVYETPDTCGAERPRWVPIDVDVVDLAMELRNEEHGRRFGCAPEGCLGSYMRPLGPTGGPYAIQARSSEGGGRATIHVSIGRDGSLSVE